METFCVTFEPVNLSRHTPRVVAACLDGMRKIRIKQIQRGFTPSIMSGEGAAKLVSFQRDEGGIFHLAVRRVAHR